MLMRSVNKSVLIILMVLVLVPSTGCKTIKGIFGKNSVNIEKQSQKIDTVDEKIVINTKDKLDQIGLFSYGVSYTLNSVTNRSPEVNIAKDLNLRISSLSSTPAIEQMKVMQDTIDNLLSNLETERTKGKKQLIQFDQTISKIQIYSGLLISQKDLEIKKYMVLSADTALKTDQLQQELNDYAGWFGLKAVGKGLWQFTKTSMWFLLGGGVLFIVLRIFASANPIAGAIFSVMGVIGGYIIKAVGGLVPRAVEFSGNIATSAYKESKLLLTKIVDSLQILKNLQDKLGRDITLRELFIELDKSMDMKEKEVIDKVKKELGY